MKKHLKSLSLLALAAAALLGCSKDDAQSAAAMQEVTLTLSAEKPEIDNTPEARTVYSDGHILWNAKGEKLRITYADNGTITPDQTFNVTNEAKVSSDRKTATFQFKSTLPAPTAESNYTLHALYPSSADEVSKLSSATISAEIKASQSPLANSFDPAADVMVGFSTKSYTKFPENENIPIAYQRLVAHGQVTLKQLLLRYEDETIDNITFTAPEGKKVAGKSIRIDLLKREITNESSAGNYVSLSYTEAKPDADGNFIAWFCSIPFTIEEGQPFKTEVSTNHGTYTREITARAAGISFKKNTRNLLSIDMSNADFTPHTIALEDGNYVIAVKDGETYYAMLATANGTSQRRDFLTLPEYKEPYQTDNEALVWTVTKISGTTYTITNDGKYLNNDVNDKNNDAPLSGTEVKLTIKNNDDGTHYIPDKSENRILSKNGTYGFAFYKTTSSYPSDLYFIPAEIKMVPSITVAEKTLTLAADDKEPHPIDVTLKNATADDVTCVTYEGSESTTEASWLTAEFNAEGGKYSVEIRAEANTVEEARKGRVVLTATTAEGTATATIAVEQSGQGAQIIAYEKVESAPANDDWSGEYLITSNKGTDYYACPAYTSGNNISAQKITIDTDGKIASSATTDACKMIFTKITEGTYAGKYTIRDSKGQYLYAAGGGNNSKNNYLKGQSNLTDGSFYWNITLANNTICIKVDETFATRNELRFNSSSTLFACYNTGQTAVVLYKNPQSGSGDTPAPTLPELPKPAIDADDIEINGKEVTLMWEADTNAKDYTVTFSPATLTPQTATADSDGMVWVTYTLAYETTYTISVVANPADPTAYKASQPTVLTVTTGEDPTPKITGITWNFDGETTTSNSPIIEFPADGGYVEVNINVTPEDQNNTIVYSTLTQFMIDADNTYFILSADDNTDGEAKEETLTLTLGDSTFVITLKQAGGNGGNTGLPVGTVLWSETWGASAVSNFTSYKYAGTEEYGVTGSNFNVKYTVSTGIAISTNAGISGSNIKGGTGNANLYWAKATTGSFTASDINLHGAQKVTLAFDQSRAYISIAYKIDNGTEISLGTGANGTNTYDINTNGASELTIIFTKTNSSNTSALDNISLIVAE